MSSSFMSSASFMSSSTVFVGGGNMKMVINIAALSSGEGNLLNKSDAIFPPI